MVEDAQLLLPMKSGPSTPTRAPDNQFRKCKNELNVISETPSYLNVLRLGSGVPIPSASPTRRGAVRVFKDRLSFETNLGLSSQRGVPACHTRNVLQARRAPRQIQKDGRSIGCDSSMIRILIRLSV